MTKKLPTPAPDSAAPARGGEIFRRKWQDPAWRKKKLHLLKTDVATHELHAQRGRWSRKKPPTKGLDPIVLRLTKIAVTQEDFSYDEACKRAGVGKDWLRHVTTGRVKNPGMAHVRAMLKVFGYKLAIVRIKDNEDD